MITEFRLIGLSKPKSATLGLLNADKHIFWAKLAMTKEVFDELWNYCRGSWKDKRVAIVHKSNQKYII